MAKGILVPTMVYTDTFRPELNNRSAQAFIAGLLPQQDVGYITKDLFITVYLWNGTNTDETITSISADDGAEGITWDTVPPEVVPGGTSARIIFTVTLDGPLTFSGFITITTSCKVVLLNLYGTRAPQLSGAIAYWLYDHNWESGFDDYLEWKTDIIKSFDATEQRMKLRTIPRRTWTLKYIVEGDERRSFETALRLRNTRYSVVPSPKDVLKLTAPVAAGDSTISVDPDYTDYAIGRYVIVWTDSGTYELKFIEALGANFISTVTQFNNDWPIGSFIAPARLALCADSRQISRPTDDVGVYEIDYILLGEQEKPNYGFDTHNNLIVFPFPINFMDITEDLSNSWLKLDNETGIVEYVVQDKEPVVSKDYPLLLFGVEDIDLFYQLLSYCCGRLVPFYVPSNDNSFKVIVPIVSGDNFITIENIDYVSASLGSITRSQLQIILKTGEVFRFSISDAELLPNFDEKLIFTTSFDQDISLDEIATCSWLEKVRLDADGMTVTWETNEDIRATLPMVTIK